MGKGSLRLAPLSHATATCQAALAHTIEMLQLVGIPKAQQRIRNTRQISGSMRQRAMIAMPLACNVKVLIVDEQTYARRDPSRPAS